MKNILALDIATHTGFAHSNGISGMQDFALKRGDSPGMRLLYFRSWLINFLDKAPTDLVVYEQSGRHLSQAATHVCHGLIGIAELVVAEREKAGQEIVITSAAPMELKKFVMKEFNGGAKRKMTKERMILAVETTWQDVKIESDDHADAILLLWYMLNELKIDGTVWHRSKSLV